MDEDSKTYSSPKKMSRNKKKNKKKKMNKMLLMWIVSFILLSTAALAVGTSPNPADAVAYHEFEGDFIDSVGNYDGAGTGTNFVNGIIGQGVNVTSAGDVNIGDVSELEGATAATIGCWYNFSTDQSVGLFSFGTATNDQLGIFLSGTTWFLMLQDGANTYGTGGNSGGIDDGSFHYVVFLYDGGGALDTDKLRLFVDNSEVALAYPGGNIPGATSANMNSFEYARFQQQASSFDGVIDECYITDVTLTTDQLTYLYQTGTPGADQQYPFAPPAENFTVTVEDYWDASDVDTVTAIISLPNGTAYFFQNTTGNKIFTTLLLNDSVIVNMNITGQNYFGNSVFNHNMTASLTTTLNQSAISFEAFNTFGDPVNSNYTIETTTKTNNTPFPLKAGQYNVTFSSAGFFNQTQNITVTALDNLTINFTDVFDTVFKLNVTDAFNLSAVNTFNVTITSGTTINIQEQVTNGTLIVNCFSGALYNITVNSSVHFLNETENYNISANLTMSMAQSQITFNVTDVFGDVVAGATITIGTETHALSYIWPLSAGVYNATAVAPNFLPKTDEITILALDNKTITIANMTNVVLNVSAIYSLTGAAVLNFTINATGQNVGYNLVQSTTNGTMFMSLLNDTYLVKINAPGFVLDEDTIVIQTNTTKVFSLFQIGDLELRIFNTSDGLQFTQNVTLKIQNSTNQRTITLENGSDFFTDLNYGTLYTLTFSSFGFSNNLYSITYDAVQNVNVFDAYLTRNDTDEIQYIVTDTRDVNLEDALVTVERFVNDTPVVVGTQLSDVTGTTTFLLNISESVRITISKDGYSTETHSLNAPLSESVVFKLVEIAPVNYTNRMTNVVWSVLPGSVVIEPDIVNFTLDIEGLDNNLAFYRVRILNNSVQVGVITGSNVSGHVLVLPFNVTPYVNGSLTMEITFQKTDYAEFTKSFVYLVREDTNNFGSLVAVRLWFENNTETGTKVMFWMFLFIIGTILIAAGSFQLFNDPLKGIPLLMVYVIITGWLVDINHFILGFLGAIFLLGIFFSKRRGGLE